MPTAVAAARGGGAAGRAVPAPPARASAGVGDGAAGWVATVSQEVLAPAFWFDPGEERGKPYRVTVWFSGYRAGVRGRPKPGDSFTREESFAGIVAGSGPVAVTAEIRGLNAGDWVVTARPLARPGSRMVRPYGTGRNTSAVGRRGMLWPRRVVPVVRSAPVRTALLPFAKVPGIIRFAYSALVVLGALAGLGVQAALLARAHFPAGGALVVSVYAVLAGMAGAKAWYIVAHGGHRFDGWCIQGFVAGAAAIAISAPVLGLGIPEGVYLAAAAPGLLIGMAIGRPGCFWAGCCVGRPTASRWGIWSSDRRIGCRRIPAQLLEAALALLAGLAALTVVLTVGLDRSGPVAVAALALYTLGRQFILALRAEPPHKTRLTGPVTAAAAAAALIASVIVLALA